MDTQKVLAVLYFPMKREIKATTVGQSELGFATELPETLSLDAMVLEELIKARDCEKLDLMVKEIIKTVDEIKSQSIEVPNLKAQIEGLTKELENEKKKYQELDTLKQMLEIQQTMSQTEMEKKDQKISDLELKLRGDKTEIQKKIDELEKNLDAKQKEIEALQKEKDRLNLQVDGVNYLLGQKVMKIEDLQSQIKILTEKSQNLTEKLEESTKELTNKVKIVTDLTDKESQMQNELSQLKISNNDNKNQIENLKSQLKTAGEERDEIVRQKEAELIKIQQEKVGLEKELQKKKDEITQASEEIKDLENEVNLKKEEAKHLEEKVTELESLLGAVVQLFNDSVDDENITDLGSFIQTFGEGVNKLLATGIKSKKKIPQAKTTIPQKSTTTTTKPDLPPPSTQPPSVPAPSPVEPKSSGSKPIKKPGTNEFLEEIVLKLKALLTNEFMELFAVKTKEEILRGMMFGRLHNINSDKRDSPNTWDQVAKMVKPSEIRGVFIEPFQKNDIESLQAFIKWRYDNRSRYLDTPKSIETNESEIISIEEIEVKLLQFLDSWKSRFDKDAKKAIPKEEFLYVLWGVSVVNSSYFYAKFKFTITTKTQTTVIATIHKNIADIIQQLIDFPLKQ